MRPFGTIFGRDRNKAVAGEISGLLIELSRRPTSPTTTREKHDHRTLI